MLAPKSPRVTILVKSSGMAIRPFTRGKHGSQRHHASQLPSALATHQPDTMEFLLHSAMEVQLPSTLADVLFVPEPIRDSVPKLTDTSPVPDPIPESDPEFTDALPVAESADALPVEPVPEEAGTLPVAEPVVEFLFPS